MKEALFYKAQPESKVSCFLCNHKCLIEEGKFGLCRVRQNLKGVLYSLNYGKLAASHVDPVEKKPLYHFLPGSSTYSIASIGCNFSCDFCQNWQISQAAEARKMHTQEFAVEPDEVASDALRSQCKSISYTYTEPTIYFEFAYECALLAQKKNLKNIFVTNGYMSEVALRQIAPYLDAANVDLKSFQETFYRTRCKARLTPVLDNIRLMKKLGVWVEVTTLLIPGENDSVDELTNIAQFIAQVDSHMPWHVSAFRPEYKLIDKIATPLTSLGQAYRIGKKCGLKFIYLGNVTSDEGSTTFCPSCTKPLIKRMGFLVTGNQIKAGRCGYCNAEIKGVWG